MEISFRLPDEVAGQLSRRWPHLPRRALEALVAAGYREELLTAAQVGELLGLSTRWEVDALLKLEGAYLHYDEEDLAADLRVLTQCKAVEV